MNRTIIAAIKLLVITSFAIFLIGCGGGSAGGDADGNGTPPNTALTISATNFSSTTIDGNITLEISSPNITDISVIMDNIQLESDNYNITITSISPSILRFDSPSVTKTLTISFSYAGSSTITLNNIKLKYQKTVLSKLTNSSISTNEILENIKLEPTSVTGGSTGVSSNNSLELIAYAPNTVINTPNESITITLQVNDLNSSPAKPAINELIYALPLNPEDGSFDSLSKTTDSNGRVTFTYTSSSTPKYGTQLSLMFYSSTYPDVQVPLTLDFIQQNTSTVSNMYISPSDFTISNAGETKTINIVTVDNQNIGVSTHLTIQQPNFTDNVNYGSFNTTSLTTDASGSASITYTAPNDITGLSDRDIVITEDSTNLQKTLRIHFASTVTDTNATTYEINTIVADSIPLESDGSFMVNIQKFGNPDTLINSQYVKDVNVTTDFPDQLTILDSNYNSASSKTIRLQTTSISGTVYVNINAKVFNGVEDVILTATVPVTILSGPVAAISLFYVDTQYDNFLGLFKDKYTIHAIDKYSNPVNTGVQLYPTLINGFKTVSSNGEILNGVNAQFQDSTASFTAVVNLADDDRLIVLPSLNAFNKAYLGGWTINTINNNTTLTLVEDYNGTNTASLRYIIGNKSRFIRDGIALADIQSTTNSYVTDKNGNVQFNITYDRILVGHTFSISAVAYDAQGRSGASVRKVFKGQGYTYSADNVPNDGGSHSSTIGISIKPVGEPLVNLKIDPTSVTASPVDFCDINVSASNFTTNNNGQFSVIVNTKGVTDPNVDAKTCTVSWNPSNSSIYYEY